MASNNIYRSDNMYELNWYGKLETIENIYKPTNKKLIED